MNNYSIVKIMSGDDKGYFIKGTNLLHREDGPDIIYANGDKEYWVNGIWLKNITTDEELIIKLLLE